LKATTLTLLDSEEIIMRRDVSCPRTVVFAGVLVFSNLAAAQTTIIGRTASIFRYHGDTIWYERDTTLTRTIIRGDTVVNTSSINGIMRYDLTYVVRGDSARLIDARYGMGLDPNTVGKTAPASAVLMYHMLAETELRMASTRALMNPYDLEPPRSPELARTYDVSAEVRITQHRNTVFFVRGCPSLGRVDTTVFLMFGDDSVHRVSPPRTFGKAMNISLTSQMRSALLRERTRMRQAPLPPDFPRAPGGCP
jgi:hypothetical protein